MEWVFGVVWCGVAARGGAGRGRTSLTCNSGRTVIVATYTKPPETIARRISDIFSKLSDNNPTVVPRNANKAVQNCRRMALFEEGRSLRAVQTKPNTC